MLNPTDTIVMMIRTMNAHRQRIVSKGLSKLCRGLSQRVASAVQQNFCFLEVERNYNLI